MCVMSVSYYWEEGVWFLMHIASIRFRHLIQENVYICRANCTASFLPLSERYRENFQASKIDSQIKWLVKMEIFSPTHIKPSIKPGSAWVRVQLVSPADSLPESWPAEHSGRRGWSPPGWASHTQLTAAWRTWSVTEKEKKKMSECCCLRTPIQLLHLFDTVFESSCNTRGMVYFANESSLKVISTDHQRGN